MSALRNEAEESYIGLWIPMPPQLTNLREVTSMAKARTAGKSKQAGTEPPKKSVKDHSEHPENSSDSTVRHADSKIGKTKGGFPSGEYDVTKPAPAGGKKQSVKQTLLEQHHAESDVETIKKANAKPSANRLSKEEFSLALETLPAGSVIEHEGENRWRVKGVLGGGYRWGHGTTAQEAINSYVFGTAVGDYTQQGAQAFHDLHPRQQKEIVDRDRKAAARLGQDPNNTPEQLARDEFVANQKAASKAGPFATNAEIASLQQEAGFERGTGKTTEQAAAKRTGARQRTGSTARKGSKSKSGAKGKK